MTTTPVQDAAIERLREEYDGIRAIGRLAGGRLDVIAGDGSRFLVWPGGTVRSYPPKGRD